MSSPPPMIVTFPNMNLIAAYPVFSQITALHSINNVFNLILDELPASPKQERQAVVRLIAYISSLIRKVCQK